MTTHTVNLALQGGGAHGAFTWGVLDALLEEGSLSFRTISGTSAGAMNGAVMASGLLQGGPDDARALLERFWRRVSESGRFGAAPLPPGFAASAPFSMMAAGASASFDMLSRLVSPYQFNPLGLNPLRAILADMVDVEALQKSDRIRLHVSATDVRRGRVKIFSGKALTVDALLASACLPQLFQAIEIDGSHYWDGGYMGNPPLFPLTQCRASQDILIVQIDPFRRTDVPKSAEGIADRLNEISFNSPLLAELRGLHLVNTLLEKGCLPEGNACGLRPLYIHIIGDEQGMAMQTLESKFNTDWNFLQGLRDIGRAAAQKWLAAHAARLGNRSSADVPRLLGAG